MDKENNFRRIEQGVIRIKRCATCKRGIKPILRVEDDVGYIDLEITDAVITLKDIQSKIKAIYQYWHDEIETTIETLKPSITTYEFVDYPLVSLVATVEMDEA